MDFRTRILHLARSRDRADNVRRLQTELPAPVEIHTAVDAATLTDDITGHHVRRDLHRPRYPFDLNPGEIACFLSYRELWRAAVRDNVAATLIVEDDIHIDPDIFASAIACAIANIEQLGYIQLASRPLKGHRRQVLEGAGVTILEAETVPVRMWCQLVSRRAAEQLLRGSNRFDRPVDAHLQLRGVTGQPIFTLYPSGVSEIASQLGGSHIQAWPDAVPWIEREWKRCLYRHRLRTHSRREFRQLRTGNHD